MGPLSYDPKLGYIKKSAKVADSGFGNCVAQLNSTAEAERKPFQIVVHRESVKHN